MVQAPLSLSSPARPVRPPDLDDAGRSYSRGAQHERVPLASAAPASAGHRSAQMSSPVIGHTILPGQSSRSALTSARAPFPGVAALWHPAAAPRRPAAERAVAAAVLQVQCFMIVNSYWIARLHAQGHEYGTAVRCARTPATSQRAGERVADSGQLFQLGLDLLQPRFEQGAHLGAARSCVHFQDGADVLQRQADALGSAHKPKPGDRLAVVETVPRRGFGRGSNQPFSLVEANRRGGHACEARGLAHGQELVLGWGARGHWCSSLHLQVRCKVKRDATVRLAAGRLQSPADGGLCKERNSRQSGQQV